MKKQVKMISIMLMLIILITSVSSVVLATAKQTLDSLNGQGTIETSGIINFGNAIIAIVRVVGIVVAVVILLVIGIKYMLGSAEERAEYKKTMIPYIVGAVLIFASTTIVTVVYDLAQSVNANNATNTPS